MNVLSRYIFSSILRTQLAVFFVLMLIFLSQGFIKLITNVSRGKVPVDMVSQLLMLSVPTMSNFMLPLSLFLAILFCIGSLCSQSEMVVMRSVGLSAHHQRGKRRLDLHHSLTSYQKNELIRSARFLLALNFFLLSSVMT